MAKKFNESSPIVKEMDKVVKTAEAALAQDVVKEVTPKKENTLQNKRIIAKAPVPFRRKPDLSAEYIAGMMPVGVSFDITKEFNSKIYGDFYKLENGMYITKGGLYTIS